MNNISDILIVMTLFCTVLASPIDYDFFGRKLQTKNDESTTNYMGLQQTKQDYTKELLSLKLMTKLENSKYIEEMPLAVWQSRLPYYKAISSNYLPIRKNEDMKRKDDKDEIIFVTVPIYLKIPVFQEIELKDDEKIRWNITVEPWKELIKQKLQQVIRVLTPETIMISHDPRRMFTKTTTSTFRTTSSRISATLQELNSQKLSKNYSANIVENMTTTRNETSNRTTHETTLKPLILHKNKGDVNQNFRVGNFGGEHETPKSSEELPPETGLRSNKLLQELQYFAYIILPIVFIAPFIILLVCWFCRPGGCCCNFLKCEREDPDKYSDCSSYCGRCSKR